MEPRERFVADDDEMTSHEKIVTTEAMGEDARRSRPRSECTSGVSEDWREQG